MLDIGVRMGGSLKCLTKLLDGLFLLGDDTNKFGYVLGSFCAAEHPSSLNYIDHFIEDEALS
jgi:hypothetical protein